MSLLRSIKYSTSFVLITTAASLAQTPLSPAITFQGQLKQNGSQANGTFPMIFKLWNDALLSAPANQVGPTLTFDGIGIDPAPVSVSNGLFSVQLNFGASAFNGDKRWLEITVSGNILSPRQELTAAPYARFSTAPWATNGANISNTNAGSVGIGTASPAQKLSVAGTVESTSGGFKFPDGTSQTTAAGAAFPPANLIAAWGYDADGETNVPAGNFLAVAAGDYHSLAIRSDGTLAGWGSNGPGEATVPSGTFIAIAGGLSFSLGIRSDGTLAGWGYKGSGQTTAPAGTFTAVSAGYDHGLAIRSNGTLAAWGSNSDGQINAPAGTFIAVAAGAYHSLAIRSDGTLAGWGYNSDGQINVPAGTFTAVAAGAYHSIGLRTDGTLAAWGYNGDGQTTVPTGTYTAVSAGYSHSLAIRTVGTLAGWGGNYSGQLDLPSRRCTAISAGDSHSLGIFPGVSLDGGILAGSSSIDGSLAIEGQASIGGNCSIGGATSIQSNATVLGRLAVGSNLSSCTLDAAGSIRARLGAPGPSGINNNGFAFGFPSDGSTGLFSVADGQLSFFSGATERMRINSNGNVGIGSTSSAVRLTIEGGTDTALSGGGYLQLGNIASSNISIDDNEIMARSNGAVSGLFLNHEGGNVIIADLGAGNLGVGTSNPAQKLHVIGNICATGSIGACSDARFKTNIKPLQNALSLVQKLLPVRFDWKRTEYPDKQFTDQRQVGFIAQDVKKVVPEAVSEGSDGYLSVDYGRLTPVIVEAVQEQQEQVKRLSAENAELRANGDTGGVAPGNSNSIQWRRPMNMPKRLLLGFLSLASMLSSSSAQTGGGFDLKWNTVDGGGLINSTGGSFAVLGTIGQSDAAAQPVMNGGGFELTGGFWSVTQVCFCPGDLNGDGLKNGADIEKFVGCILAGGNCSCADTDLANGVSLADVPVFVNLLLAGPGCP